MNWIHNSLPATKRGRYFVTLKQQKYVEDRLTETQHFIYQAIWMDNRFMLEGGIFYDGFEKKTYICETMEHKKSVTIRAITAWANYEPYIEEE